MSDPTDTAMDIPADKNGPTIPNGQVRAGESVDNGADIEAPELTAEEARDLADDLGLQLYRAQDALDFVEECCVIAEREGSTITVADVRQWLKGAQCGRQLAAENPVLVIDPAAPPLHFVTYTWNTSPDSTVMPYFAGGSEQSPRTTADNSPTSSDTADNSLRDQLQAAIESEVYEFRERTMWWPEGEITKEIARLATRGAMEIRDRELEELRAKVAEFDHIINWHTTCASCARILDSAYQETVRAEKAEQQRDRLAGVLGEALAAFVRKIDGYRIPRRSAEADVVTLDKWRSILAENREQR